MFVKNILNLIDNNCHYLTVLNKINKLLPIEIPGITKSVFSFNRNGEEIVAVAYENNTGNESDGISFPIKTIGQWDIGKEIPFTDFEKKELDEIAHYLTEKVFFEEWEFSYKFSQNKGCKYFPCHKVKDENTFSCLFCYCPLYRIENCGGNCTFLENGVKNCINCTLPHQEKNYEYIMEKLAPKDT